MRVIKETRFAGISPAARGKVRDIYDLGDQLLIVATDRLSAFDVVLPTPIPDKGRVLTQLSLFWFNLLRDAIPNHVLSATDFPPPFDSYEDDLAGRSMIVRKTQPLSIEARHFSYVDRGLYSAQLERVFKFFPREQVKIVKFEEFRDRKQETLDRIFDFLSVKRLRVTRDKDRNVVPYERGMTPEERKYMLEVFSAEIAKLEQMLGWNLADWRATT